MSEHAWSQEHIAAYLAGGLDASECERLEAHLRECPACASALEANRRLDSGLASLFDVAHPRPDLEDRALQAFRRTRDVQPVRLGGGWRRRVAIAAGVAAVLTAGGFVGMHIDQLPTPEGLTEGQYARGPAAPAGNSQEAIPEKELTNEDLGLQSQLESALPERANLERLSAESERTLLTHEQAKGLEYSPPQRATIIRRTRPQERNKADVESLGDASTGIPNYYAYNGTAPYTPPNGSFGFGEQRAGGRETKEYMFRTPSNGSLPSSSSGETIPQTDQPPGPTWSLPVTGKPSDSVSTLNTVVPVQKEIKVMEKSPVEETGLVAQETPVARPKAPPANGEAAGRNIVIRTGEMEFIVDSFDAAAATITKLVSGIKGGYVSTTNSEKLSNGKMKGTVTVRVPPEQLDGLVLDLRRELAKGGELTGSRIGSQDITKQYTDLESRLKAARTMETRLLQIIKDGGKGEIKGLIEAERELGNWQTRIEEYEGELRFYSNRVALSTLTITLTEREIQAAAGIIESERVQAGVEVEDVDPAYQKLLAAVAEAKGRITKSEMKQQSAGQFSATVHFEVAPDAAGPLRDRLRQLGRVARLDIDRFQRPEGVVTKNAKIERGDTLFFVQLYNLANIAPREVAVLQTAVTEVPTAFRSLREAVSKASGRVLLAQLNEQDLQNISAQLDFEVRRGDEPELRSIIEGLGEVVSRQVTRAQEGDNVTDAKVMIRATLVAANQLKPREKTTLSLEVSDVDQTATVFAAQVKEVKGRQVDSQFTRDRAGRLTARLVFEAPLASARGLVEQFKSAGAVRIYQSTRDPQAPEGKYATARIEVTITSVDRIVGADEGVWPQVRQGLTYSASVLLISVRWVVFGLCAVLPWVVIGYLIFRILRSVFRSNRSTAPATTTTST